MASFEGPGLTTLTGNFIESWAAMPCIRRVPEGLVIDLKGWAGEIQHQMMT